LQNIWRGLVESNEELQAVSKRLSPQNLSNIDTMNAMVCTCIYRLNLNDIEARLDYDPDKRTFRSGSTEPKAEYGALREKICAAVGINPDPKKGTLGWIPGLQTLQTIDAAKIPLARAAREVLNGKGPGAREAMLVIFTYVDEAGETLEAVATNADRKQAAAEGKPLADYIRADMIKTFNESAEPSVSWVERTKQGGLDALVEQYLQ
jgi:hypothetical protein